MGAEATSSGFRDALGYSLTNAYGLLREAFIQSTSMGVLSTLAAVFVLGWPGSVNAQSWSLAWHIVGAIVVTNVLQTVLVFTVRRIVNDSRYSPRYRTTSHGTSTEPTRSLR